MTMIGLPDSATLLGAFVVASLVLAVSPGPGVLYIVTRSLAQGRRAGLLSVAGVAAGNLCNALAAAFGLAALFAVSSTAFAIVKYAGAAYLVVLGVKALLAGSRPAGPLEAATLPRRRSLLRDGFLVALLNPKTTLFFAAVHGCQCPADAAGRRTRCLVCRDRRMHRLGLRARRRHPGRTYRSIGTAAPVWPLLERRDPDRPRAGRRVGRFSWHRAGREHPLNDLPATASDAATTTAAVAARSRRQPGELPITAVAQTDCLAQQLAPLRIDRRQP